MDGEAQTAQTAGVLPTINRATMLIAWYLTAISTVLSETCVATDTLIEKLKAAGYSPELIRETVAIFARVTEAANATIDLVPSLRAIGSQGTGAPVPVAVPDILASGPHLVRVARAASPATGATASPGGFSG
jgi:hypothetical protein